MASWFTFLCSAQAMSKYRRVDLIRTFAGTPGDGRVGIEVELAPLTPATGEVVVYPGPRGLEALLSLCAKEFDGQPLVERDAVVGLALRGGAKISLENGGAVEYSSAPRRRVGEAIAEAGDALKRLAAIADELDIALVPGANLPFTTINNILWVPNARGEIMRRHFAEQGRASAFGPHVMALTTSTQATLDYESPSDLMDKLRALSATSTLAAALFVNSPLAGGRPTGYQSERMRYWSAIDPARTGPVPAGLRERGGVEDFAAWAMRVPMLFRKHPDGTATSVHRPFAALLREGFADGSRPTEQDWLSHLSQIWTDVRVRRTIEARSLDGPPAHAIGAVPAFWAGLAYSARARRAAWELIGPSDPAEHRTTWIDIARRGLAADWRGRPVRPLAAELLRIAEVGLREVEPDALPLLDSVREVVATGRTFATETLSRWDGDPARYVARARLR